MNYGEFKALIAAQAHRNDLTSQLDGFVDRAKARLDRDMRVREMLDAETLTPVTNPFELPAGFLEMRDIYHTRNGTRVTLTLVNRRMLNFYASTNVSQANPRFYSVDGTQIETRPGGETVVFESLFYKQITPLVNDSDTSIILDRFPDVWLYAALDELYTFTQNTEEKVKAEQVYVNEMKSSNQRAREAESGASLQMQGASQWL